MAHNVNAFRNRDLNNRDACYYGWDEHVQSWYLLEKNTYSYVGWSNVGSGTADLIEAYKAC